MPEIKVTILGTEKLLKNLDPTKATGPDQIPVPAHILKQFAAEFAPHLTTIFNTSLHSVTQESRDPLPGVPSYSIIIKLP
jgi:hypothetical protein